MTKITSRMLGRSLQVSLLSAAAVSGIAAAQDGERSADRLGVSLRLGFEFETEPDAAVALRNFGSRATWNDRYASGGGPDVLAFVDLAYGPDESVRTREAWLGLEGGFGTIKGGTQFRAFYDAVSSFTDIGWWDTCYAGVGCSRTNGVLKYETELTPTVRVVASTTLSDNVFGGGGGGSLLTDFDPTPGFDNLPGLDNVPPGVGPTAGRGEAGGGAAAGENEFIDQLEGGAILTSGAVEIGAAFGIDLTGDTGFVVGTSVRTALDGALDVGAALQFASEDYVDLGNGTDRRQLVRTGLGENLILASVSANTENVYGLLSIGDSTDTLFGFTAGYVLPLAGTSRAYAEVSGIDPGGPGSDFDFNARVVYVYHFGAPEAARRR